MRKREHFSYLNGGLVAKRWHICLDQLISAVNISALKISNFEITVLFHIDATSAQKTVELQRCLGVVETSVYGLYFLNFCRSKNHQMVTAWEIMNLALIIQL